MLAQDTQTQTRTQTKKDTVKDAGTDTPTDTKLITLMPSARVYLFKVFVSTAPVVKCEMDYAITRTHTYPSSNPNPPLSTSSL